MRYILSLINRLLSKANAEKVVNALKNPGIRNDLILNDAVQYNVNTSVSSPKAKQPIKLIKNICKGMPNAAIGNILPKATLATAPRAPPIPIIT